MGAVGCISGFLEAAWRMPSFIITLAMGAGGKGFLLQYQIELVGPLPDVFRTHWKPLDGRMPLPDEPGLGVEVDEDALGKISAAVTRWRSPSA